MLNNAPPRFELPDLCNRRKQLCLKGVLAGIKRGHSEIETTTEKILLTDHHRALTFEGRRRYVQDLAP